MNDSFINTLEKIAKKKEKNPVLEKAKDGAITGAKILGGTGMIAGALNGARTNRGMLSEAIKSGAKGTLAGAGVGAALGATSHTKREKTAYNNVDDAFEKIALMMTDSEYKRVAKAMESAKKNLNMETPKNIGYSIESFLSPEQIKKMRGMAKNQVKNTAPIVNSAKKLGRVGKIAIPAAIGTGIGAAIAAKKLHDRKEKTASDIIDDTFEKIAIELNNEKKLVKNKAKLLSDDPNMKKAKKQGTINGAIKGTKIGAGVGAGLGLLAGSTSAILSSKMNKNKSFQNVMEAAALIGNNVGKDALSSAGFGAAIGALKGRKNAKLKFADKKLDKEKTASDIIDDTFKKIY